MFYSCYLDYYCYSRYLHIQINTLPYYIWVQQKKIHAKCLNLLTSNCILWALHTHTLPLRSLTQRDGGMAWWLRALLIALVGDLGWFPSICIRKFTTTCDSSSWGSDRCPLTSEGICIPVVQRNSCKHTHAHRKFLNLSLQSYLI